MAAPAATAPGPTAWPCSAKEREGRPAGTAGPFARADPRARPTPLAPRCGGTAGENPSGRTAQRRIARGDCKARRSEQLCATCATGSSARRHPRHDARAPQRSSEVTAGSARTSAHADERAVVHHTRHKSHAPHRSQKREGRRKIPTRWSRRPSFAPAERRPRRRPRRHDGKVLQGAQAEQTC